MAKADKKVTDLRRKSRFSALRTLSQQRGLPVKPRKAMAQARKASKERGYLVAPYPNANPLQIFNWAKTEWTRLGRWQSLAAPVAVVVALLTWEKEMALQEEEQALADKAATRRLAARVYNMAEADKPKKKRKLLGFIPLPGK